MLTNTLPNLTRAQATVKITVADGMIASSVSRKTDCVVTGEGGGAKLAAARWWSVSVIDEPELLRMLTKD